MALNLMGKKRGMIQLFDDKGNSVACTVIEVIPNIVTQIKTKENDGYTAVQLGFGEVKTKDPRTLDRRLGKPVHGSFKKHNLAPMKHLQESRLDNVDAYTLGQPVGVDAFKEVEFVDATAMSKGKGYQGVMKRHHYAGGPASHGSGFHRHAGSRGMRTTPGRVLPLGKAAGHMGYDKRTVQNLKVILNDSADNLLVVQGAVPGPKGALISLKAAEKKKTAGVKKQHKKK